MKPETTGAWIVHHAKKLKHFNGGQEFETISEAGKAGELLSALASNEFGSVTNDQVKAIAHAQTLSRFEVEGLLGDLENLRVIKRGEHGIDVLGITTSSILLHTHNLFESLAPTAESRAVIDLAEQASNRPLDQKHALEIVQDGFSIPTAASKELLTHATEIGFVDSEELDPINRLFFNGHLFRRESAQKMVRVMSSLTQAESQKMQTAEVILKQRGCASKEDVEGELGAQLFEKLHAIGLYDVHEVSNDRETVLYVTQPAAFGKFGNPFEDDALDLAKAFVACLVYGMTRSTAGRGRINFLRALLTKLVNGSEVGPATAIGQDYHVLEVRRVVQVRRALGGRYYMKLLKREVGELALNVLINGEATMDVLPDFGGVAATTYGSPEERRRLTRRRQLKPSKKSSAEVLHALRTSK